MAHSPGNRPPSASPVPAARLAESDQVVTQAECAHPNVTATKIGPEHDGPHDTGWVCNDCGTRSWE